MCRLSRNPGSLYLLKPPGPVLVCTGITLINTQFQDNCTVEKKLQYLTSWRTTLRDNLRVAPLVYNFPVLYETRSFFATFPKSSSAKKQKLFFPLRLNIYIDFFQIKPVCLKNSIWSLNLLEPSGPVQACNWIALHLPLFLRWNASEETNTIRFDIM